MIDIQYIKEEVVRYLESTEYFFVDIALLEDNQIEVEIDRKGGVDIDFCCELNHYIESLLDRDKEDFTLVVGSAGLTSPFKVLKQYQKNIGNEVEVLTKDGGKLRGVLKEADEQHFSIVEQVKERREGDKRPKVYENELSFEYDKIKQVTYLINIK